MGKLKDYLLAEKSEKKDQYFINLYDTAEKAAKNVDQSEKGHGIKIIGAEDIYIEIKKLLAKDLSFTDFDEETIIKMYSRALDLDLCINKKEPPKSASEQEHVDYQLYLSKFAAIQQALMNYTLGDNYAANLELALSRFRHDNKINVVQNLIACFEEYKADLQKIALNLQCASILELALIEKILDNPTLENVRKKLEVVGQFLYVLRLESIDIDSKLETFTHIYLQSPMHHYFKKEQTSAILSISQALVTMVTKNINTAYQEIKMDNFEKKYLSILDDIVENYIADMKDNDRSLINNKKPS